MTVYQQFRDSLVRRLVTTTIEASESSGSPGNLSAVISRRVSLLSVLYIFDYCGNKLYNNLGRFIAV